MEIAEIISSETAASVNIGAISYRARCTEAGCGLMLTSFSSAWRRAASSPSNVPRG
jgi:hypothetical protein